MLGLFKKKIGDKDILINWGEYKNDRDKLSALLDKDLKIINKERKLLRQAVTALRKSGKVSDDHLSVIKKRLDLVHSRLLSADELSGEETKLQPAETTTLRSLSETVDKIKDLLKEKQRSLK